ncbi:hypothetical protein E1161_13280 [Saccharopolyspora aridisoli]|uniref:Uncharacterized protein n=1 Tax=Saccharopolyspora aridisoli TaxID=2530385 RepID=A0A4R4UKP5_9PSEU|nr:hypothetical protein [Saccharopolyspora aridisoli]TDC92341.1 hypothetical protein E1161_13280 [Saccharopolyspora aridisoli]
MPVYVYLAGFSWATADTGHQECSQTELTRAYESISVLCDELEQTQRALATKDRELTSLKRRLSDLAGTA